MATSEVPKGYYRVKEIAEFFAFSVSYFDRDVRPHLPDGAIIYRGRIPYFHSPTICRWLCDRAVAKAMTTEEALLSGPNSKWLEAFRRERTLMERLKRTNAERNVVAVADIEGVYSRWTQVLRSATSLVRKRFGVGAGDLLGRALQAVESDKQRWMAEFAAAGPPIDETATDDA